MSRTQRLQELAARLRSGELVTVAMLSEEFGVSRRTLLRDLDALRESGMFVEGATGPGGGVCLRDDRGLASVHMTLAEIVSLWLAATLAHSTSHLPWGSSTKTAMNKLLASLPANKAKALRKLCKRVVLGEPANEQVRNSAKEPPKELLGVFEEAFSSGRGLSFGYVDGAGRTSSRRVEPHGLLVQVPVWYILAFDLDKREARSFRMDRIARPRILEDVSFVAEEAIIAKQMPPFGRLLRLA